MPGGFGLPKKFNGKMAEPMIPFFLGGLIVAWGINAGANAMMASDEYKNDPRNPNAATQKKAENNH